MLTVQRQGGRLLFLCSPHMLTIDDMIASGLAPTRNSLTLNPEPCTSHLTPATPHPEPYTSNLKPASPHSEPHTPNLKPATPHLQPYTPNPEPYTLNPQPWTLDPKPPKRPSAPLDSSAGFSESVESCRIYKGICGILPYIHGNPWNPAVYMWEFVESCRMYIGIRIHMGKAVRE